MFEQVKKMLEECEDLYVSVIGKTLQVTVEDFEGFDDDWSEVMRDYDEEAVDVIYEWLESHCESEDGDFYHYFDFGSFDVCWGYASYDI